MNWYHLAIISFLAVGLQNYLYKIVSLKNLPTRIVTLVFVLCTALLSWSLVIFSENSRLLSTSTILLACLDAVFYYFTIISRIEALHYIPTYLVFPIARLSTFFTVLYGVAFFGEAFTIRLVIAILLLTVSVLLISSDKSQDKIDHPNYSLGIIFALVAMITSIGGGVISKYAAIDANYFVYTGTSNSLIALITLVDLKHKKSKLTLDLIKQVFPISFFIGLINLVGWLSCLYALESGPLSTVSIIIGLAFLVPIVLSVLLGHETITAKKCLVVGLTGMIIVVLKL